MDEIAEKGLAAHYKYKSIIEGGINKRLDDWLGGIREVLDNKSLNAIDFINDLEINMAGHDITVFTPKGKMVKMPYEATVLDFAFDVHSQLGINCMGAKINFKVVPIDHVLHSADQVEIITSSIAEPTNQWLKIAKTTKAKQAIKAYLKNKGIEKLQTLFSNLSIDYTEENVEQLRHYSGIASHVDFFCEIFGDNIGEKDIRKCFNMEKTSNWSILNPFAIMRRKSQDDTTIKDKMLQKAQINPEAILLDKNTKDLTYCTATCCNPIQGDDIVGFKTGKTIEIHRTNCKVAMDEMTVHSKRMIKTKWRKNENIEFLTGIKMIGFDRKGLLQDLTGVVSKEWNANIRNLVMESSDGLFNGSLFIYVSDTTSLTKLIEDLSKIDGVETVKRI
jgi:GTP pyrophosphokinase